MTKLCNFADCGKKHRARGYCNGHYQQQRLGLPLTPLRIYVYIDTHAKDGYKVCSTCKISKSVSEYGSSTQTSDGYSAYCKPCRALYERLRTYNITKEHYEKMLLEQDGKCAICNNVMVVINVDHDHSCCPGNKSCGRCVRSLLCYGCNNGLGCFRDDVQRLAAAINYLNCSSQSNEIER